MCVRDLYRIHLEDTQEIDNSDGLWKGNYGIGVGVVYNFHCLSFLKKTLFISRERGREGEREGNIHMCHLSSAPYWGPDLQPRHVPRPTGNQTGNPLVHRPALHPLSHTSQGFVFFKDFIYLFSLFIFLYCLIFFNMCIYF